MSRASKIEGAEDHAVLAPLDRMILQEFQNGFPLSPRPYADMAAQLGTDEESVLAALERLRTDGLISRVGAVFAPHRAGWSTLAAIAVPPERLAPVAELVSAYPEVNHNYEREHDFNLWFVVTAADEARVGEVLADIHARTGLEIIDLPLVESFHIDLGFPIRWS